MVKTRDEKGELLLRLGDGRVIDTRAWDGWEWTQGVGLYGLWNYYKVTGSSKYLKIIKDWFLARFHEGTTTKNINTMAVFLTLAYIYEMEPHAVAYLPYLDSWAEWAMNDLPRTKFGGFQHMTYLSLHDGQLWVDTLMMTVLPLAKTGLLLNRPNYVEEAKRQFLVHVKYLADNKTGLCYHGWTFNNGGNNFANAYWARGNSWLTMTIPEFIELLDLPPEDHLRKYLIDVLEAQINALASLQAKDVRWHTLLDHPDSYLESSATAGFAFGILKAVRKRYISSNLDTGAKAVKAIIANIDTSGELKGTSFGTPVFETLDLYTTIPIRSMPHGQAMAIMALVEFSYLFY